MIWFRVRKWRLFCFPQLCLTHLWGIFGLVKWVLSFLFLVAKMYCKMELMLSFIWFSGYEYVMLWPSCSWYIGLHLARHSVASIPHPVTVTSVAASFSIMTSVYRFFWHSRYILLFLYLFVTNTYTWWQWDPSTAKSYNSSLAAECYEESFLQNDIIN